MAKKLTDFKNPLTASSGNVLDFSMWLGGVLWVVMVGMILALGVKALNKVDSIVPGNNTPNVAPYKAEPVTGTPYTVL